MGSSTHRNGGPSGPPFEVQPPSGSPVVTVGIPVHDGGDYLPQALDSIRGQTFTDFELLISDNASTDDTEEICRSAVADDPRIRYDRLPRNLGAAANYNRLVHAASGEWFKWASHDDLVDPTFLERLLDHVATGPRPVLAYPKTTLIDDEGNHLRDHEDNLELLASQPYRRIAVLARRWSLCNAVFGIIDRRVLQQTSLIGAYIGSDVTLLAELALAGEFHEVPQRLFHRRIHARSSRQGELTLDEIAHWFDTDQDEAPWLHPRNLVMARIVQSIAGSDLSLAEKARCSVAYCGTWGYRRTRMRGGRVKQRLRDRARPTGDDDSTR